MHQRLTRAGHKKLLVHLGHANITLVCLCLIMTPGIAAAIDICNYIALLVDVSPVPVNKSTSHRTRADSDIIACQRCPQMFLSVSVFCSVGFFFQQLI